MGAARQIASFFFFSALAMLVGATRSSIGLLDRQTYLVWGLVLTLGIPATLTGMLMLTTHEVPKGQPDPRLGWFVLAWGNGFFGAVTVVIVAILGHLNAHM